MNYTQLLAAIQTYTENDDSTFVAQIPDFVKQTEKYIYHATSLPLTRLTATSSLLNGNQYLAAPTDFLQPYAFNVTVAGDQLFLLLMDVNFIREAFPDPSDTGVPTHYAIFDNDSFILGPTPDSTYVCELNYFGYPESIVTASTSFLGDNFDAALLYGTLLHAYTFMKGEDSLLATYKQHFDAALAQVKQYGDAKTRRDYYRPGQLTLPVV